MAMPPTFPKLPPAEEERIGCRPSRARRCNSPPRSPSTAPSPRDMTWTSPRPRPDLADLAPTSPRPRPDLAPTSPRPRRRWRCAVPARPAVTVGVGDRREAASGRDARGAADARRGARARPVVPRRISVAKEEMTWKRAAPAALCPSAVRRWSRRASRSCRPVGRPRRGGGGELGGGGGAVRRRGGSLQRVHRRRRGVHRGAIPPASTSPPSSIPASISRHPRLGLASPFASDLASFIQVYEVAQEGEEWREACKWHGVRERLMLPATAAAAARGARCELRPPPPPLPAGFEAAVRPLPLRRARARRRAARRLAAGRRLGARHGAARPAPRRPVARALPRRRGGGVRPEAAAGSLRGRSGASRGGGEQAPGRVRCG